MASPTVAAAIITYKGGKSLKACLASLKDHVDEIVVLDTGPKPDQQTIKTVKWAKGRYFHSSAHRCIHGLDGIDSFADARNECWSHVMSDWCLWVDSDDVVINPERIKPLVEANADSDGIWLTYLYARDEYGNVNTMFNRERIVKLSAGWEWRNRVHEVLMPSRPAAWVQSDEVVIDHENGYANKSTRNFHLLNLMLEEDTDNPRVWLYMGNQHFFAQQFEEAEKWYKKFYLDQRALPDERYWARIYACKCLRVLRRYTEALSTANGAVLDHPDIADGYLEMGETLASMGDYRRAISWLEDSKAKRQPERLVVINPLDYSFRAPSLLSSCYASIGEIDKAITETRKALAIRPNQKELLENLEVFHRTKLDMGVVESYLTLAEGQKDKVVVDSAKILLDGLAQTETIRDVIIPAQMRMAPKGTQPTLDIFCGGTVKPFTPITKEEEWLGGSETAVVEIAQRLQKAGWKVTVYNDPGDDEGWHDGVGYIKYTRFDMSEARDVLVSWRNPDLGGWPINAQKRWLWMHDLNKGPEFTEKLGAGFDRVFGVSRWHSEYLENAYPFLKGKTGYFHNGVDLSRFEGEVKKQRFKCIWSSSPDRGLPLLLKMWPTIRTVEPSAELHIFYGWDSIDGLIRAGYTGLLVFKQSIINMIEKLGGEKAGIYWRGGVGQKVLAKEIMSSDVWLYPTSFLEVFCISAVEMMMGGVIPVTSRLGAIPEVVGDKVPLVSGIATSKAYQAEWVGLAFAALLDVEAKISMRSNALERGVIWTWERALQEWEEALRESPIPGEVEEEMFHATPV